MKRTIFVLICWAALSLQSGCPDPNPQRTPIPPTIQILEPDDSVAMPQYAFGESITFSASASDNYDQSADLVVVWSTTWIDEEQNEQQAHLGDTTVGNDGRSTLSTAALEAGTHTVTAEVTDSDDLTAYDFVDVLVYAYNEPPTVEITAPVDLDVFDEGESVNFSAVAGDDLDVEGLSVVWRSNLDGEFNWDSPSGTGVLNFQAADLSAGEHEVTVEVTDDGENTANDNVTFTIVPENQPPSMPSVDIQPLGPGVGDDLVCYASGSVDPEGGLVTYTYEWDLDGLPSGWATDVLDSSNTATGDEWTCRVTPWDPEGLDGDEGSATTIIDNSLPSFSSVTLTPTTAYEDSLLSCEGFGWYDPDGDAEGALYEWLVDSSTVAGATLSVLDGNDFDRDDVVECIITPYDGIDSGLPLTSNPVTILNSPPPDPVVEIQPTPLLTTDTVTCMVTNQDPDLDGDLIVYSYEWLLDGAAQPQYSGLFSVPSSDTEIGQEWECQVQGSDGYVLSNWVSAFATVVPAEGDLVITEIMIDPVVVDDSYGEYIEIYNTTAGAIPLDGFVLRDAGIDYHQINSGGLAYVMAGDYFVLGINSNPGTNGDVTVDYQYASFEMDNGPDRVELEFVGVIVDAVDYDWGTNFPAPSAASMSLAVGVLNAIDNDLGVNWCGSTTPIYQWGDAGTPGAANDSCDCWDSDSDGDGFGVHGDCTYTDCDDADATIYPGAQEVCEDGTDQDCDGSDAICTCAQTDLDGDGYGTSNLCVLIDCDDSDPAIYPGATETCNFIDDDCDGVVDDGFDVDGDGYTTCNGDCDDGYAATYPGAAEICDGEDNDCDGLYPADEDDDDGDGWMVCDGDCDDLDPAINPLATEICDGDDNNCNGTTDEAWSNCTPPNASGGCSGGSCIVGTCDPTWYDMNGNYPDGCEAQEDSWETFDLGGDDCTLAVDGGWVLPDTSYNTQTISGNIVPANDTDYYLVHFTDGADANYANDPFNVTASIADANDGFRIAVYEDTCAVFSHGTPTVTCTTELTSFSHDSTGEQPCVNNSTTPGYNECNDDSINLIIKVFRIGGTNDDTPYTLTVSNG